MWQGGGERRERENTTNNTKSSTTQPWEFHPGNYSLTQGTRVCSYLEGERHGSKFKIHFIVICSEKSLITYK